MLKKISLQTRTKLQQVLKGVSSCCKQENAFDFKRGFPILSVTKTLYSKTLYLALFINFNVVSAMSHVCHLLLEKGKSFNNTSVWDFTPL